MIRFIDLTDYAKNATNPNYTPVFHPVAVGVPQQSAAGEVTYVVPSQTGYVADNVPVNIGAPIRLTRPYFYPEGAEADAQPASTPANPRGDARYVPTLVMTQDHHVLALPKAVNPQTIAAYQQSFKAAKLVWGVPQAELSDATDPAKPFGLQISPATPAGSGGILTWSRGTTLPENASIASLWPLVVFSKLLDDKDHKADPQSVVLQGNRDQPIVLIQGITLNQDSLLTTAPGQVPLAPTAGALRDHVTALVRPAAIALFRARGIDVHYTFRNLENTVNGQRMELDVVLENDRDTVVIEVKSMVRARDVDDFLDELNALLEFFTRYAGRRVYAGIAGLDFAEGADRYAYHKGLFVLGLTGEGLVTIRNDLKFRPRDFGAGAADLAA